MIMQGPVLLSPEDPRKLTFAAGRGIQAALLSSRIRDVGQVATDRMRSTWRDRSCSA